jgi:RecA/RadA recombinase
VAKAAKKVKAAPKKKAAEKPAKNKKLKAPKVKVKIKVAKKAPKAEKTAVKAVDLKAGFRPSYSAVLSVVEKKFKLSTNMNDRFKYAITTGSLVKDMQLGGGVVSGGMYTNAGGEQSAKSTDIANFLATQVQLPPEERPGMILCLDPEGSTDQHYFGNMLRYKKMPATEIWGVQDKKGNYSVEPLIYYYPENRGEQVLDFLNGVLQRLPDMELVEDQWYYVYENTNEHRKLAGDQYDKQLFSKFNKFYIPSASKAPQLVAVIDSWVSLVPERMDNEDSGSGLGAVARMFAEYLPKIKGKLRRKNAILLGVNQLREKPMAMGDPRYEPGGTALRFQSDVRMWHTARVIPKELMGSGASGMVMEEPSVTGEGVDHYRFIHLRTQKNKLSTPGIEGWARIWVADENGEARGMDPAFDVFYYLRMTGQLKGNARKLEVSMDKGTIKFKGTMLDLKKLVLLKGKERDAAFKKLGMQKSVDLWRYCRKQIESGKAKSLMVEFNKTKSGDEDEES